ncbi:MAG: DUF1883 domain-containing protein [Flavobacteriales bacterium]|nr:DUF1883 domain-containing protein [Flavobacteriales bacterium]MCB9193662.1 DUF1883 domain-containing protein [Flavobacteriales bacterium]
MKFLYKQFQGKKKQIVEVEIDQPTKIKFMTAPEFKAYKDHRTHRYFGGTFDVSPVRFVLPYDAVWSVVVEKGSARDPIEIRASCKLLPPDRGVLSTLAIDAPNHVRETLEEEMQTLGPAAEVGTGSDEEGSTN